MALNLPYLLNSLNSGAELKDLLPPHIRCRVETNESSGWGRVLLTTNRNADFNDDFARVCNGVVLLCGGSNDADQHPKWKLAAVPAPMFHLRYNVKKLHSVIDAAVHSKGAPPTITAVSDGTTVTLYYFEGKWRMSSTNGYEINEYKWMGDLTYEEALKQVLDQYPEFSFDKLRHDVSYTIGFRHHNFHPLLTDPQRAWFIRAYDTCSNNLVKNDTGLPNQQAIPLLSSRDLTSLCNMSMPNYFNSLKTQNTPSIFYGCIVSIDGSDYMMESELLSFIRRTVYNAKKPYITHANRLEYSIMRAYLSPRTSRFLFAGMFPQFAAWTKKYDMWFNTLSAKILDILSTQATLHTTHNTLSDTLANWIRRTIHINTTDSAAKSIIYDLLLDARQIDLYFEHFDEF